MSDDALQAEVARLRAENEALRRQGLTRARVRRGSKVLLLVLGCGLAALSVVAIWLRVTLLDTDRYVQTVTPIAAEPAVQKAVADKLDAAIQKNINFQPLIREALPDRADVLAPALERGLQSFIRSRIDDFTASDRFQQLWVEANRRAHTRLVELLTGGRSGRLALDQDTVYLDLSPAVDRVKAALQERGLYRLAAAIPPTVDGRIELVQSHALVSAQRGIRLLKALSWLLPILALLCLAGSIWLSRPRLRGVLHAAIGIALAMLLVVAALAVARSAYLDALGSGALPRDAASDIFDTVAAFLRHGLKIVLIAAVVLAALTFLAGLPLGRFWNALATSPRRAWIARNRTMLLSIVGGLAGLALVVWSPLTGGVVLVIALVAVILAAVIFVLALPLPEPP
ncbi:MAG TPA: hypothetical protein VNS09_16515 [Solirubrobacter sp.]|nr:hypothetical protein [Solirubrobacter sp.]